MEESDNLLQNLVFSGEPFISCKCWLYCDGVSYFALRHCLPLLAMIILRGYGSCSFSWILKCPYAYLETIVWLASVIKDTHALFLASNSIMVVVFPFIFILSFKVKYLNSCHANFIFYTLWCKSNKLSYLLDLHHIYLLLFWWTLMLVLFKSVYPFSYLWTMCW